MFNNTKIEMPGKKINIYKIRNFFTSKVSSVDLSSYGLLVNRFSVFRSCFSYGLRLVCYFDCAIFHDENRSYLLVLHRFVSSTLLSIVEYVFIQRFLFEINILFLIIECCASINVTLI